VWVAQYAVGRWLSDLRGLPVVGLYVAILTADLVTGGSAGVGDVVWGLTLPLPAYFVGVLVRRWSDRTQRLALETEPLPSAPGHGDRPRDRRATGRAARRGGPLGLPDRAGGAD